MPSLKQEIERLLLNKTIRMERRIDGTKVEISFGPIKVIDITADSDDEVCLILRNSDSTPSEWVRLDMRDVYIYEPEVLANA